MKKYMKYIAAGLAVMIGASCEKVQETTTEDGTREFVYDGYGVPMSFKAKGQDVMKSDIDMGESAVVWDSDDAIAIYDGTELREFTVSSRSSGNKIATFSGSANEVSTYYSVTPFSAASLSESNINVNLPSTQTVIGGNCVDGEAMVATATAASGADISFTNQFSLLKIHIEGSNVVSVALSGNNGEAICGEQTFSTSDGSFTGTPSGKTIHLMYKASAESDYGAFPAGDYFIVLWPTDFTGGFKLIMTKSDGSKAAKSTSSDVNFGLNSGANASTIDDVTTWSPTTITTASQLKMWRRVAEDYAEGDEVKLGADINLEGYAWTPVDRFLGVFNGQGHKIYNLTIGNPSMSEIGFIRNLGSTNEEFAVIRDVVFGSSDGTSYDGSSSITLSIASSESTAYAALIGRAYRNSIIRDVTNFIPVTATSSLTTKHSIAGIVGFVGNREVTIESCINRAAITDNSSCETKDFSGFGGILGYSDGVKLTMTDCINYGTVTNNCVGISAIGGVVGKTTSTATQMTMTGCINNGKVSNTAACVSDTKGEWDVCIGGVIGYLGGENSVLDKCTNTGDLCHDGTTDGDYDYCYGGIVGRANKVATIKGCTNSGQIYKEGESFKSASYLAAGGILGYTNKAVTITKSGDGTRTTNTGQFIQLYEHTAPLYVGGIVGLGDNAGFTVEYCTNYGRIVSDPSGQSGTKDFYGGGICGSAQAIIDNCINNGYIFTWAKTLTSYLGGICGGWKQAPVQITNCINNGYISPYNCTNGVNNSTNTPVSKAGGILAHFKPSFTFVSNCTNTGMVTTGDFYRNGAENNPGTLRNFYDRAHYLGGLFGYVDAPTSDVTDNVTDCVVACTLGHKTGSSNVKYEGLIAGYVASTSSTPYKLVFGTSTNPVMIVNTTTFQYGTDANPAVITPGDVITTEALAKKWLMGSYSSFYDASNGSSDTDKVDFHFSVVTPATAGIE